MIVVVVGDVTADRVREALEKRLGDWPRNPGARETVLPDLPVQAAPASSEIPIPDKSQTSIVWGHSGGLRRSDPDFYATQVMSLILGGGGLTSRLSTAIRDDQGLAYSVYGYFDASLYPGPFRVVLGTNPANARKAVAALGAEIQRIRRDGVTPREVEEAVAYLTGRFPLRLETSAGVAEILWGMEFFNLGADYIDRYAGYYRAVTVEQVNDAAARPPPSGPGDGRDRRTPALAVGAARSRPARSLEPPHAMTAARCRPPQRKARRAPPRAS